MRAIGFGALIVLSLAGCALVLGMGWLTPQTLVAVARDAGWQGALLFVGLVISMELLWLPRMWALIAASMLYGPVRGVLISMVADTGSALVCFAIGRGAGRGWVERLVARRPKAQRVMRLLVQRRGATTVALLRMVPVAHYTLVSYLVGLAGISPRAFVLGNTIGLVPGAVLYAAVGASVLEPTSPVFLIAMGVLVVALMITAIVGRRLLR